MRVLIVTESHFIKDSEGNVWCDRVIDYNFLKRYLNVFEEVAVAARMSTVNEPIKDKLLVSGDRVSFVPLPEFKGAAGTIRNFLKVRRAIKNVISKYDCVIMRAPSHLSFMTYGLFLKKRIPFAVEFVMAADKMTEGDGFISGIINSILIRIAKDLCMKANGVAYVTEFTLQATYPCRAMQNNDNNFFTTHYSSIDLNENDFYERVWSSETVKKNPFKLIHVGYMDSYRKGQDVAIRALKSLKNRNLDVELTLIGDGNNRRIFEQLSEGLNLKESVHFLGFLNNKHEILEKLKESHLFIFPTKSEGLPRSIIEAMATGLPCVASPVDGIPELIDKDFLVDNWDAESYADLVAGLIANRDKLISTSAQNYQKAREYTSDKLVKRRNDFYSQLKQVTLGTVS